MEYDPNTDPEMIARQYAFEHPDDFNARDFDQPESDDDIEYAIQGDYGQGWENVTYEFGLEAAKAMLADYRANDPHPHRMIPWSGEL